MRLIGVCVAALASTASADVSVSVTCNAQGWYASNGTSNPGAGNTFTGSQFLTLYRSYAAFDLAGVTQEISSARLRIAWEELPIYTNDPSETLMVGGYSGNVATLVNGSGGLGAHADLGDGPVFGQIVVPAGMGPGVRTYDLSPGGVAGLNAGRGGALALGFWVADLNDPLEWVRPSNGAALAYTLDLTLVPAPGAAAIGLLALAWPRPHPRRRHTS